MIGRGKHFKQRYQWQPSFAKVTFVRRTALMMIKKTLRIINRYRHIYINVDLNPLAKPNASHTPRQREACVEDRQQLQLHYRREQRRGEEEVGDLFKLDWSQEKIWQRTAQDRLTWMGHAEAFSTLTDNRRQRAAIPCDDTRAPAAYIATDSTVPHSNRRKKRPSCNMCRCSRKQTGRNCESPVGDGCNKLPHQIF